MKVCKECGENFEPSNKKGVFCSAKCRQKDYRKSVAEKLVQLKDLTKPTKTNEVKPPETTNTTIDTKDKFAWIAERRKNIPKEVEEKVEKWMDEKDKIQAEIDKYESEILTLQKGQWGDIRKNGLQRKIADLKKQLYKPL